MRRLGLWGASALAIGVFSAPARGQVVVSAPVVETAMATEVSLTTKLLGAQMRELTQIAATIAHLKYLLKSANQGLSMARSVVRAYRVLKDYSWEKLQRDAKRGLHQAMPELAEIEREWGALKVNGGAVRDGKFWQHKSYHDVVTDEFLVATGSFALRASVYPALAPEAFEQHTGGHKLGEAERLVQYHFERAKMRRQRALQNMAFYQQSQKLRLLIEDAESKDQADLKIATISAASDHQTAINTQFLRDATAVDIARAEARRKLGAQAEAQTLRALTQIEEPLLGIGLVK